MCHTTGGPGPYRYTFWWLFVHNFTSQKKKKKEREIVKRETEHISEGFLKWCNLLVSIGVLVPVSWHPDMTAVILSLSLMPLPVCWLSLFCPSPLIMAPDLGLGPHHLTTEGRDLNTGPGPHFPGWNKLFNLGLFWYSSPTVYYYYCGSSSSWFILAYLQPLRLHLSRSS